VLGDRVVLKRKRCSSLLVLGQDFVLKRRYQKHFVRGAF
jgi:hypothetical protein